MQFLPRKGGEYYRKPLPDAKKYPVFSSNAEFRGAERGVACCDKMPKAFPAGRGVFGVRWNDLLEAIFSLMPDTEYIDFLFMHEITSKVVSNDQIANDFWVRSSMHLRAQHWKRLELVDSLQNR